MTQIEKWQHRNMVIMCRGYLESTYKALCKATGEEYEKDLTLTKLAEKVADFYNKLNLNKDL